MRGIECLKIEYTSNAISKNMSRLSQLASVQTEALELFRNKNQDYGDAFATYGPVGVLVRIGDKLARLQSISRKGVSISVNDESLRDTLMDLHNYSAMAVMLMDEKPPTQLRAWRLPTGVIQHDGTTEVIIREARTPTGDIHRECSCRTFSREGFCIHTHDEALVGNNYEIIEPESA